MISFWQLTALPYVCLGYSLLLRLGDGVRFLGGTAWSLVWIALKLIRVCKTTFIGLKSGAG